MDFQPAMSAGTRHAASLGVLFGARSKRNRASDAGNQWSCEVLLHIMNIHYLTALNNPTGPYVGIAPSAGSRVQGTSSVWLWDW